MADFVQIGGFANYSVTGPQRSLHSRSFSTTNTSFDTSKATPRAPRPMSKSISNPSLPKVVSAFNVPGAASLGPFATFEELDGNISTIPDPRSRAMSPANENVPTAPMQHSDEVAALSNKLVKAMNYQSSLDDTLSATRHELETSRQRVQELEAKTKEHEDLIASGTMVEKLTVEAEKNVLISNLAEEKRLRTQAEKERKEMEGELETLTTSLFEEANAMVHQAREGAQKDQLVIQKKNDQLIAQLADTESLLKSQQEQLLELKQVIEQMTEERDDRTSQTAPSTPGFSKFDSNNDLVDGHPAFVQEPMSPSYPTSFNHLVQVVVRSDLAAYEDFTALLKMSKRTAGSRVSSGSYGSMGLGLGLGGYSASQPAPGTGSTSSIATAGTVGSSPATPTTPASSVSGRSMNEPNVLTPLNKTEFYKRALAEDIEPTLRLDTAPGLSWLARRTVQNAICEGTLVVDPMPASTKSYAFPCSLCGECRDDADHARSHRFRANESQSAQKYPLCKYCLGRVRSTCDFIQFLRILKDGHWRADDAESEKAAWEESVRLREQMFWARMGGGVVPVVHDALKSPRIGNDEQKEVHSKLSDELIRAGELKARDITPLKLAPQRISKDFEPRPAALRPASIEVPSEAVVVSEKSPAQVEISEVPRKSSDSNRISTQTTTSLHVGSPSMGEKDEAKRLSITIPGSFD